ncbi:MAG: adenylyltransferase/cytidyltransferase family protein [Deltaproteobacteria bacterium]|jgi:glycerol-3-phosphate cytidylyltransferase|nr:adenylyltransferase/cytidyltransferase family protein [Deltaproteobacteria bacterium]MBT6492603.1 adenylyltransferase/cytidyltransferase family protein [Deltaproteobacteria bacterium]
MAKVITFGTFDLFHVGHLRILERARALGDSLCVGVSSDELNMSKKGKLPVCRLEDRLAIVRALRCVDEVFVEHDLALKGQYIQEQAADIMVMGEDWKGRFDDMNEYCKVVYLERTPSISTTALLEVIRRP